DAQLARTDAQLARTDAQLARTDAQLTRTDRGLARLSREMAEFKKEMRADRKALNKKWGELSNKLGTLAEDIVAPSIPGIFRRVVDCPEPEELDMLAVRMKRKHPVFSGESQEFDVVAVCGAHVLITETKSNLSSEKVNDFVELMEKARAYFPEYGDKERYHFLGALAALYVDKSLARYGERKGVLILGLGDEMMDVLNKNTEALRRF
ncbi:MAG: hypothetical protein ACE5GO_04765, partial [Anaerolineales bacterium]